jgi:hypothetical protein
MTVQQAKKKTVGYFLLKDSVKLGALRLNDAAQRKHDQVHGRKS